MPVEVIHSFLVHPAKLSSTQPEIWGTEVPRDGDLYPFLSELYDRAPRECNIEVVFRPDEESEQSNACRNGLEEYLWTPEIEVGKRVAQRLQAVTTRRSGLGLLFLIRGTDEDGGHVLVLSRFPADQGIIAQEEDGELHVAFLEQVFLKNARAYKSAFYTAEAPGVQLLEGRAVDKQISGPYDLSQYWIAEFLESELRTTSRLGSQRLAVALRDAARSGAGLQLRRELVAATELVRGRHGNYVTIRRVLEDFGVSPGAVELVEKSLRRSELMDETFQFDLEEFEKHITYRLVELDTGAMLVAERRRFDDVFAAQPVDDGARVRYTTEGQVIDERFKKRR